MFTKNLSTSFTKTKLSLIKILSYSSSQKFIFELLIIILAYILKVKYVFYFIFKIFISSSTVEFPAIPKFSTRTSTTFGDKNAGRVGPR